MGVVFHVCICIWNMVFFDCQRSTIYRIAGNFDGGKFWCFWRFPARPSKLNPSIFKPIQYLVKDTDHPSKIFHQIFKVSIRQNLPLSKFPAIRYTEKYKTHTWPDFAVCKRKQQQVWPFCHFHCYLMLARNRGNQRSSVMDLQIFITPRALIFVQSSLSEFHFCGLWCAHEIYEN